jgi:carbohydrate kinase (thermoresistant glucokinase family)
MNHIIFIMGVSGSGKTTIGKLLSLKTGIPFFDGDDFHSADNKAKMRSGTPLNDNDRKQWLQKLNTLTIEQYNLKGAIIACSALKEKYRTALSKNIDHPKWIFLQGTYELIHERMKKRDHFMPVQLLQSQFNDLEIPASAFTINIKNGPDKIVEIILQHFYKRGTKIE